MKIQELAALVADGDVAHAAETRLLEAIGQRVVRTPIGWDWESLAAECDCGLLLTPLSRPVTLERVVVTLGRAMPVRYRLTHVHAADAAGRLVCKDCMASGDPCPGHDADMCDTPTPVECTNCTDGAAMPGGDFCLACRPYEPEWDKDLYLGL